MLLMNKYLIIVNTDKDIADNIFSIIEKQLIGVNIGISLFKQLPVVNLRLKYF